MLIKETENCYDVEAYVDELEDDTKVILFNLRGEEIGFDKEQSIEVVKILQHFIETGELPE
ncbi:hypothetical protein DMB24_24110 [Salmonella enterica]|uniref:Uncharacterized protein n=3 Tax=Cornellvirus TaxID=1910993 RepID=S4TRD8_9CAUD|nr:hypothetical protein N275_gp12 [Salmonella phage FSL SP-031]AGF88958.1 hypothetical protein SP049_00185 [Salmonella phage FSL SP-049]AGF89609.1 hypothetical protein SP038_00100 [Salmonella phage FSL SP-038]EAP2989519.1 hypothetical protein [Salmonella enterica]EBH8405778.1 hypothetical protein [Salmonella enterica subsp. enterica serovar Cerro]ECX6244427.1 hypothetical protein [Salmonella enterica subsp. enterica serovar Dublin]